MERARLGSAPGVCIRRVVMEQPLCSFVGTFGREVDLVINSMLVGETGNRNELVVGETDNCCELPKLRWLAC